MNLIIQKHRCSISMVLMYFRTPSSLWRTLSSAPLRLTLTCSILESGHGVHCGRGREAVYSSDDTSDEQLSTNSPTNVDLSSVHVRNMSSAKRVEVEPNVEPNEHNAKFVCMNHHDWKCEKLFWSKADYCDQISCRNRNMSEKSARAHASR